MTQSDLRSGSQTARVGNVGMREREISLLSGGALLFYALLKPSRLRMPFLLAGGYLAFRGFSGRCFVYQGMGIDRGDSQGLTGIRVSDSVTINRPPHDVYAFWRDFTHLPAFMQHLKSVEVTGERTSRWVAWAPMDATVEWEAEIDEDRPGELISWHSKPGASLENQGAVRFADAPGGRGTVVSVEMEYRPPGGSAGAAFAWLFGKEASQQVKDALRRFKQVMETGETATVLGQTSGRVPQVEDERDELHRRKGVDVVQEASQESFPASDAPGWTGGPTI